MKTLLKWALPVFIGTVPAFGAQDKAFLSHDGALYKIISVRESEVLNVTKLTATIDATFLDHEKMQRDITVKDPLGRFAATGWSHHDAKLYSNRKGKVYISLFKDGARIAETEPFIYTKEEEIAYGEGKTEVVNLLQGAVISDDKLSLGATVDVATQKNYTRPDNTSYIVTQVLNRALIQATLEDKVLTDNDLLQLPLTSETNPAIEVYKIPYVGEMLNFEGKQLIYKLAIRENRVPGPIKDRCYEHKNETSGKGFNIKTTFRHWYEHYNTTLVTPKVVKILTNNQEVDYLTGTPQDEWVFNSRDEGRTNRPDCTAPYDQNFPPITKVVKK